MSKHRKSKVKKKELIGKAAACCLTASLVTGAFAVYANALSFETEIPVAGMSLTLNNYYIKNEDGVNSQIARLSNPIVGSVGDGTATLILDENQTTGEPQSSEEETSTQEETSIQEESTNPEELGSYDEPLENPSETTETTESQDETTSVQEQTAQTLDSEPSTTSETETSAETKSIYDTIAVSRCYDYVNVRSMPSTDGEILGKIYDGCAATILEVEGDWYKIESGSVEGYIKAEYFVTGAEAEALAEKLANKIATVNTTTLRVRASADINSDCVTFVPLGEEFMIMEEENGWGRIEIDASTNGWVSMEFLDVRVEFDTAVSIEEEEAKIAEQEAAKKRADEARIHAEEEAQAARQRAEEARKREEESKRAAQATTIVETTTAETTTAAETEQVTEAQMPQGAEETQPQTEVQTEPETEAITEPETTQAETEAQTQAPEIADNNANAALREAIVTYALQFVGNPYVYGGNSLTNGTDCSGFVKLIYQEFGYSLTRRASLQYNEGRRISVDELKPGDLIFYGNGEVDHVTMYIGNGQVVHASTARTGIKISSMNYRSIYGAVSIID